MASYALEIGLMLVSVVLTALALLVYVKCSSKEDIPPEYFFKVREPKIRQRREMEAKIQALSEKNQVEL